MVDYGQTPGMPLQPRQIDSLSKTRRHQNAEALLLPRLSLQELQTSKGLKLRCRALGCEFPELVVRRLRDGNIPVSAPGGAEIGKRELYARKAKGAKCRTRPLAERGARFRDQLLHRVSIRPCPPRQRYSARRRSGLHRKSVRWFRRDAGQGCRAAGNLPWKNRAPGKVCVFAGWPGSRRHSRRDVRSDGENGVS